MSVIRLPIRWSLGYLFFPNICNAKNETPPLYVRIKMKGEGIELSLQRLILLTLWDEYNSRLKDQALKHLK